ncbi:MAG: helix-turn-helix domain-containing protein [Thiobacillus sp.]|nr:helix-turn-helix domain-containing protein [Thiobacillus sp.]
MSEDAQLSIGQTLRAAREAQSMSLDDAAAHLRLMHRQIEAMEADDFASLGQTVFARGFVRNYARLLGLAPEDLLARMGGAPSEAAPITQAEPPPPAAWLTSPWLILMLLGTLIVVAVPVALYLWLNSEVEDDLPSRKPSAMQTESAPAITPAPVAAPAEEAPAPAEAAPVPAVEPVRAPAAPLPAPTFQDPAEAGAPAAPPPANGSVLRFDFGDEAWVEVKDGSGRMVHRQLNPAGSRVDIQGRPPFELVVGNATQVRMHYNGRPIDLKPFIAVTVARFTLEE